MRINVSDRVWCLVLVSLCAFAWTEMTFANMETPISIRTKNECFVSGDKVAFSGMFDIRYSKPNDAKSRVVYQLECTQKSKECTGVTLDLTDGVVSYLTLGTILNAKLLSAKGSNFIVEWGDFRTFVIDLDKKTVSYRESGKSLLTGKNVEGSATLSCR